MYLLIYIWYICVDNWNVFSLPKVAELLIHKVKQRSCPLLDANKHTIKYMIYLFETIVSKAWPSSSVFFNYKYYFSWGRNRGNIEHFLLLLSRKPVKPSLRNYNLKQINNIYTYHIYIYFIYMCVCLFASSKGQSLCFSLWKIRGFSILI